MKYLGYLHKYATIVLIGFVALVFFIRCYKHVHSGDELLYEYVWEKGDTKDLWQKGHRFERKVETLGNIIQTQVIHYKLVNGRSIVHAVEQAFTDHDISFSVINTIVLLMFVTLIVKYLSRTVDFKNYALWLAVILVVLLLFPYQQSLWTSVNYGINYLWTSAMAVGMLILWDGVEYNKIPAKYNVLLVIYGLVFGWTHEAFVIGLAGGMFLFYCLNFKLYRQQKLLLTIPFWISACVMIFSPGNMIRFFGKNGNSGGFLVKLSNGFDNLLHLNQIWVLILLTVVIWSVFGKDRLLLLAKANSRLLCVFAVSFLFSMIANTAPYSHTFVELTAMLLIFSFLSELGFFNLRSIKLMAVVITLLFIPQQLVLARDTIANYNIQLRMVEDYVNSQDGLVEAELPDISNSSKPYIRLWDKETMSLYTGVFNSVYAKGEKNPLFLFHDDFVAVSNPDKFFSKAEKFPGNAPLYTMDGCQYLWLKPGDIKQGTKLIASYYPVDWHHNAQYLVRLKFLLMADTYPSTGILTVDTIHTQYGESYFVKYPPVRKIKEINISQ